MQDKTARACQLDFDISLRWLYVKTVNFGFHFELEA
jgi:hypothetical protein